MAFGQLTKPSFFFRYRFTFTISILENDSEWWLTHQAISPQHRFDTVLWKFKFSTNTKKKPSQALYFQFHFKWSWNIVNNVLTAIPKWFGAAKMLRTRKKSLFLWKWNADGTEFAAWLFFIHFIAISTDISIDAYVIYHMNTNTTHHTHTTLGCELATGLTFRT